MEQLCGTRVTPTFSHRYGNGGCRSGATEWKRETFREPQASYSDAACGRLAERAQSGAVGHRCKIQFHRRRALRSLSFTDWVAPRPGFISTELLRVSSGVYSAGNR